MFFICICMWTWDLSAAFVSCVSQRCTCVQTLLGCITFSELFPSCLFSLLSPRLTGLKEAWISKLFSLLRGLHTHDSEFTMDTKLIQAQKVQAQKPAEAGCLRTRKVIKLNYFWQDFSAQNYEDWRVDGEMDGWNHYLYFAALINIPGGLVCAQQRFL